MTTALEEARKMAAAWCADQPFPSKRAEADLITAGSYDHHSLVTAFLAAIELGERREREARAGTDWFAGNVDCDGNELITLPRQELAMLCLTARTSGGVAGRDDALCAALDRVERHFPIPKMESGHDD